MAPFPETSLINVGHGTTSPEPSTSPQEFLPQENTSPVSVRARQC